MRCKLCVHYKPHHSYTQFMVCVSSHITKGYVQMKPSIDGVHVEDDEGWGMIVGPDYGCVHFSQKEEPK